MNEASGHHELTRTFDIGGFSLAWGEWGSGGGPPLVLLHGFSGSAHDFELQIDALAEDRRVLAIDHRGHGRSTNSFDEATYTVDHILDDVIAWLNETVDGPVDLLGHSLGGRVALRFALAARERLRSMILADTTAWSFEFEDPARAERALGHFASLTPERVMGPPPDTPEAALIAESVPAAWQVRRAELDAAFDPMAAKALGRAIFGNELQPVDHLLGDIDVPVTVIVGEHDHPYIDRAPDLANGVVDGELVVIEGAHHSPQLTHRAQWLAAVRSHLARVG